MAIEGELLHPLSPSVVKGVNIIWTILDETRFVERFQFFNGQRLFASDLQGADDFNREMRWTHNRSLGQPGIGSGFAVYGKERIARL